MPLDRTKDGFPESAANVPIPGSTETARRPAAKSRVRWLRRSGRTSTGATSQESLLSHAPNQDRFLSTTSKQTPPRSANANKRRPTVVPVGSSNCSKSVWRRRNPQTAAEQRRPRANRLFRLNSAASSCLARRATAIEIGKDAEVPRPTRFFLSAAFSGASESVNRTAYPGLCVKATPGSQRDRPAQVHAQ